MLFVVVGITTALVYALWVLWVPLLPDNLFIPLLDLGKMTGYTWPAAIHYMSIVGGLYALYAIGYRLVSRDRASTPLVFLFGSVLCIELIGAYPATAVDVFGYVAQGRVLAEHHVNPFIVPPLTFPFDPIIPYLAFPNEPSQYGPAWVLLGDLLATLARGDLLIEVVLYKAVGALAHLGGAALILAIGQRLGATPAQARAGAFLYLWNPLLLWEMIGNAHNDGLMMMGGLVAAWLLVRRSYVLVLPALALGALIKVPVVVIAPLLLVALWRRNRIAALESLALAALLVAVVYRPFWEGFDTLTALRRTDLFTASLGSVLRLGLEPPLGLGNATAVARWTSLGLFGAVGLGALLLSLRWRGDRQLLVLAYVTLLAAALLATTWFQAWYVVWPFAFAAAVAVTARHAEVALLSLGGLLQYLVFIYLWVIGVFPPTESFQLQASAYLAIVGPPLLGVAWMHRPRYARVYMHSKETAGAD